MVDKITRVSSSAPSVPTRVETSLSLAEPESAWVAHRQSAINAANEQRKRHKDAAHDRESPERSDGDCVPDPEDERDGSIRPPSEEEDAQGLSGESERIGSGNLDEEVPFGQHVGYV
ncbi:hypothetical protein [Pararhizobium sp. PWRC1-1]|uniref:hypothetical protein n=1 Tax=Pararhizobium sp. PWRC1-1 TaxID=2804566 RepID=UPI003CF79F07